MSKLEAGRELDAKVAQDVLGFEVINGWPYANDRLAENPPGEEPIRDLRPYSTDINAAIAVKDKLASMAPEIYEAFLNELPSYTAREFTLGLDTEDLWLSVPPEEICLAALKVLKKEA